MNRNLENTNKIIKIGHMPDKKCEIHFLFLRIRNMLPSSNDDIPFYPNVPVRFSHVISYVDFNQV